MVRLGVFAVAFRQELRQNKEIERFTVSVKRSRAKRTTDPAQTGNSASQPLECAKRTMAARERNSSFSVALVR